MLNCRHVGTTPDGPELNGELCFDNVNSVALGRKQDTTIKSVQYDDRKRTEQKCADRTNKTGKVNPCKILVANVVLIGMLYILATQLFVYYIHSNTKYNNATHLLSYYTYYTVLQSKFTVYNAS